MKCRNVAARIVFCLLCTASASAVQAVPRQAVPGEPVEFGPPVPGPARRDVGARYPARSDIQTLLRRSDVRNTLQINGRQREALDSLLAGANRQLVEKTRPIIAQMTQAMEAQLLPGQSQEEAQKQQAAQHHELRASLMQVMEQTVRAQDQQLEAILTAWQIARLHELDLRWRGPMALSDPKLAKQFGLSLEQIGSVNTIMNGYVTTQKTAFDSASRTRRKEQGDSPLTHEDLNAVYDIQQQKVEQAHAAAGRQTLALLTPAQVQQWYSRIGKPFTFRKQD